MHEAEMPDAKQTFMVVGKKLGHYEVLSLLGSGGMGEVYRARDTRLDREVAIKILPASYASDADRLKRFEQEARSTSALNHPNIVTVYDIGTHEDSPYIVSELLDGSELREQLDEGALPPRKAIDYAQQIVQGLAAAHEKGIIHRDLKPENLFVTSDGRVKILDFGLAKLRPQGNEVVSSEIATAKQITDPGTVIGTVGYMSPEQVRGENADHRSDIFSFGMILYEMLSGQRAFRRKSVAETMAAILREEPRALTEINPAISAHLEHIVTHCLEKRPEERFQSARDLGFSLGTLSIPSGSGSRATDGTTVANPDTTARILKREWLGWIIAGLFLIGLLASFLFAYLNKARLTDARGAKLSLLPPEKSSFDDVAISLDGRWLAFTAATGGKVQLWVRGLDSTKANALPGTDGASHPFWSPDNRFIGYFVGNKLKKIEASGGLQTTLGDVIVGTGGSWSRDGVILFSSLGGVGLSRVSASGGEVISVLKPDPRRHETDFTAPSFLPDGFHFLYTIASAQKEVAGIYLASLDSTVNERLIADYSNAVFAAGANDQGYLLFAREGALMAQPFDSARRQLTGEPFLVAPHVAGTLGSVLDLRHRIFAVSDNGVLVVDENPDRHRNQLIWVDRSGKKTRFLDDLSNATMLTLSSDDQRFVVPRLDLQTGNNNLWVADVTGKNVTRFTFDAAVDNYPVWSPDRSRIVWSSNREGVYQLYQKAASGAGQDTVLLKSDYYKFATDWSHERYIIYREVNPKTKFDVWVLPVGLQTGAQKPFPYLDTEFNEAAAVLSPDERWMAYCSDESGQYEVYVQSFPERGSKRQISIGGGIGPRWRSKELFYHALDGKLMAVEVKTGQSFEATAPVPLFEFRASGNLITAYYDVTRDGQKFLLSTIVETEPSAPLTIMLNWTSAFKK